MTQAAYTNILKWSKIQCSNGEAVEVSSNEAFK